MDALLGRLLWAIALIVPPLVILGAARPRPAPSEERSPDQLP